MNRSRSFHAICDPVSSNIRETGDTSVGELPDEVIVAHPRAELLVHVCIVT